MIPFAACAGFSAWSAVCAALPDSVPSPALHLDAGDENSAIGDGDGNLVKWSDATDPSLAFFAPGDPPRLTENAVNGRPAIRFSEGVYLVGNTATGGITNNVAGLSVFAVGMSSRSGAQNYIRIGSGDAVPAARFMLGRRSDDYRLVARRLDGGNLERLAGGEVETGAWTLVGATLDFAGANAALYVNGRMVASDESLSGAGNTSASDSLMFRIGNDHGSQYWEGKIAEILVFDRALTLSERAGVETYLSGKYDLKAGGSGDGLEFGGGAGAFRVIPGDLPNEGTVFVDHEPEGRSGHGGHAITEAKNGDIIAFYSNVSGEDFGGHGTSGWSEYRISTDGGESWSDPYILDYSMEVWEGEEFHSALVDEVMTAPNGTIVAIAGRYTDYRWGRTTPVYLLSHDHGRTWSEAREIDPEADVREVAREHASLVYDDTLFVLFNAGTRGQWPGPHSLYVSADNGETFERRSRLPFDPRTWYGAMTVTPEGHLIAYSYLTADEYHLRYTISRDGGHTWSEVEETFLEKRIRNPQVSEQLGGLYFMHGRSGHEGDDPRHLVLYTSENAIDWDSGIFLNRGSTRDLDSYSTNAIVGRYHNAVPETLLIQSSIAYDEPGRRVNIHHWRIQQNEQAER